MPRKFKFSAWERVRWIAETRVTVKNNNNNNQAIEVIGRVAVWMTRRLVEKKLGRLIHTVSAKPYGEICLRLPHPGAVASQDGGQWLRTIIPDGS